MLKRERSSVILHLYLFAYPFIIIGRAVTTYLQKGVCSNPKKKCSNRKNGDDDDDVVVGEELVGLKRRMLSFPLEPSSTIFC